MKKYILFALILGISNAAFSTQEVYAEPKNEIVTPAFTQCDVQHTPSEVTVYNDRAILTRTGTATLKKGANEIVFEGIRDNIDLRSIRVIDPNNSALEVQGITWQRHVSKQLDNVKITTLEHQRDALENQISAQNNVITATRKRLAMIGNYLELFNKSIAECGVLTEERETPRWKESFEILSRQNKELNTQIINAETQIEQLRKKLETVNREIRLQYGEGSAHSSITLIVSVIAQKEQKLPLSVSYTTHAASWHPQYDVRLNANNNEVEFMYYGVVTQNTGEKWENVKVKLSTAQPQVHAIPPSIHSVTLSGHYTEGTLKVTERNADEIEKELLAISNNLNAPTVEMGVDAITTAGFSEVTQKGPSETFTLNGTQTILSGDQANQVTIFHNTFNGVILYESAPMIRNGVYLKAKFNNATPYPILKGEVSIYRNSGFIGKSNIKYIPVGGEVGFFAGTLDEISSAKQPTMHYTREVGTFNKESEEYVCDRIVYQNTSDQNFKVRVRAQIKVSETDNVKVRVTDNPVEQLPGTTPGYVLEKETGLIYWDIEIAPNSEAQIILTHCTAKKI